MKRATDPHHRIAEMARHLSVSLRLALKRLAFATYSVGCRFGVYVLPAHYYVPVANIHELARTRSRWARKSTLPGIDSALDEQVNALTKMCLPFQSEYAGGSLYRDACARGFGQGFGEIEAEALYAVVRYLKPATIVEIGAGVTSACIASAITANSREGGRRTRHVIIDPRPSEPVCALPLVELHRHDVQDMPFEIFNQLSAGDLLFIDSSHAVRPGSDVNFLVLEVLPRLRSGVVIHFHDVFLPYDYPRDVLKSVFHWQETSLLRAYLTENPRTRIVFCMSHLHYDRPDALTRVFPDYRRADDVDGIAADPALEQGIPERVHFPASIYVERV